MNKEIIRFEEELWQRLRPELEAEEQEEFLPTELDPDDDPDEFERRPDHDKHVFQLMERMIRHMHRRQDMSKVVDQLYFQFPSAASMFRADLHQWQNLGMNHRDALLFSKITDITRYQKRESFRAHPKLSRLPLAAEYAAANFFGLQVEQFLMFCVNRQGCLKERVFLHEGTETGALFSLNKMLREVVRVSPASIILAHNHPGGTLRPSQEDIDCTRETFEILGVLNIPMLDHLIVAGDDVVSMRDNGFIPEYEWMSQNPDHRQLKNWLADDAIARNTRASRMIAKDSSADAKEEPAKAAPPRAKASGRKRSKPSG